jgi:hypothetical protein
MSMAGMVRKQISSIEVELLVLKLAAISYHQLWNAARTASSYKMDTSF